MLQTKPEGLVRRIGILERHKSLLVPDLIKVAQSPDNRGKRQRVPRNLVKPEEPDLQIRLGINGAGGPFSTTSAIALAADSGWTSAQFSLGPSSTAPASVRRR